MILVLDLDDTLLRTDKTVSAQTEAALQRWQDAGHEFVVATGRPPRTVAAVLPAALHCAPRIVYNGAQIVQCDEVIYRSEIEPADVHAVLQWTRTCAPHWHVGLEIEDQLFLNRATDRPGNYVVGDLAQMADRPAAKILFLFPGERDDLGPLLAALPAGTRALITPKFKMVQLCGSATDKANALEFWLRQRGRTLLEVVAVGDDVNDVEMVRRAGIGVAMDNAVDEVKAVADWIAPSNDADGVAVTIDRLLQAMT